MTKNDPWISIIEKIDQNVYQAKLEIHKMVAKIKWARGMYPSRDKVWKGHEGESAFRYPNLSMDPRFAEFPWT